MNVRDLSSITGGPSNQPGYEGRKDIVPTLTQTTLCLDIKRSLIDNTSWSKDVPDGKLQHLVESGDTQWETAAPGGTVNTVQLEYTSA